MSPKDARTMFPPTTYGSIIVRYAFAVLAVAVASLLRSVLTRALGEGVPFILYFPTVVVCAWFGGLWPGVLSAALGGLIAWYVFIPPHYSFAVSDPNAPGQLIVFLLSSALISLLAASLHQAKSKAEERETREREQRERFRVTLASVGDAVIATDGAGRVTLMNAVAESLTGWTFDDASGHPLDEIFNIVNEQTRESVGNPALRAIREEAIVGLANHTVLITKDGGERPIDDSGAPIKDADGKVLGAVLIFRDVTERRRAEDRFRLVVESAPNAMVMVDRKGRIVLINSQTERLFGYARGELIGQPVELLVPERSRRTHPLYRGGFHAAPEMRAMGAGRDLYGLCKDGTEVPIEIGLNPLQIEGETLVLSAIVDITERKRGEEALRRSEARFKGYFELGLIGMAITSPTKGIVEVNDKLCEILGYERSELLEKTWAELTHPDDLAADVAKFDRVLAGEVDGYSLDKRWLRKDGRIIHATISVKCLRHTDGTVDHFVALVEDITDRKRADEALREAYRDARKGQGEAESLAARLEAADRAKDEFLAMLGHELRNPLGAIAVAVGVVNVAGKSPETMERARAVIGQQVQRLSRLVDDLLDVSRVTTGKVRLTRQPLDLAELVASAVTTWREAGRFHRHHVSVDVSPAWIEADATRIEQILDNLIGNSLKYTPAEGRVTVRVEQDGKDAVLEVADSGTGIPLTLIDKVFDLFVQGDRAADRAQGGLGIGLTLVKALTTLHGGTVIASSDGIRKGSVFTVRLPSIAAPAKPRHAAPVAAPPVPHCRILIVEDNDDAREMLRIALSLAGHTVYEAADGRTGIGMAAEVAPDVALIDIGLPGLDGYEVARRIRGSANGKSIRLIAITGYGQAEDRQRALDAGFDAHLTKPVQPERLAELMRGGSTA